MPRIMAQCHGLNGLVLPGSRNRSMLGTKGKPPVPSQKAVANQLSQQDVESILSRLASSSDKQDVDQSVALVPVGAGDRATGNRQHTQIDCPRIDRRRMQLPDE